MVALTQREDLPQQDTIRPHVTLSGKHFVKDGLGRHPLQGEAGLKAIRAQYQSYKTAFM